MTAHDKHEAPLGKRLAWLVLIWVCSVAALGGAAFLMRMLMRLGGLAAP